LQDLGSQVFGPTGLEVRPGDTLFLAQPGRAAFDLAALQLPD